MTQPDNYFWCPECGAVEARSPDRGYPPPCSSPICRAAKPRPHWQTFDRDAWDECQAPRVHVSILRNWKIEPSPRKLRLQLSAFARFAFPQGRPDGPFARVAECAEVWSETGNRPDETYVVRQQFLDRVRFGAPPEDDWRYAVYCLDDQLTTRHLNAPPKAHWGALADSFRELFPNPFVPLAWNPDWITPTVRDLAAHVYASREFGAMPILADALQDAGCDDEQVLAHCRASKPHARGCWVLDAILGKS